MDDVPAAEKLTPRALDRRVKRWLLTAPFECFVQVAPGLEGLLADELETLGLRGAGTGSTVERGGVSLPLDLDGIMLANLELRTASRVLLRLGTFPAASAEMLHDRARKLPWELHIGFADTFALRMSSRRSRLQAGDEMARAVAGAVARRMSGFGLRPRPEPDAALEFAIRLENDRCTVSLNTSGEHLHRRGLRTRVGRAPARETLAAAVALLGLGRRPEPDVVVDPFCGSGAVLCEVADALSGLPPGRARPFAFERAGWFRPGRWRELRRRRGLEAAPEDGVGTSPGPGGPDRAADRADAPTAAENAGAGPRLLGLDSDARVLVAARENLDAAGHDAALLHHADSLVFDLGSLGARAGLIVSNLPYGVRLGDSRSAAGLTRRFLSRLGEGTTRWEFALLTNDAARITQHPDVRDAHVVETVGGGLRVYVVTGSVGR